MLDFMDLVQKSWLEATKWNRDNSYSELNATSQGLNSSALDLKVSNGSDSSVKRSSTSIRLLGWPSHSPP